METSILISRDKREELWKDMYLTVFPKVAQFIAKNNGQLEEAQDVFQDALVVYYEKSTTREIADPKGFIYGTARFLWYRRFGQKVGTISNDEYENAFEPIELDEPSPSESRLLKVLEIAGKKCLDLLKAFYYDGLTMIQIAGLFGFSSERSATVQKYKCLEKVRNTVKEKQLEHEDFYE